jgi:pimeloyl-ACP methyl ester carboxylesterase
MTPAMCLGDLLERQNRIDRSPSQHSHPIRRTDKITVVEAYDACSEHPPADVLTVRMSVRVFARIVGGLPVSVAIERHRRPPGVRRSAWTPSPATTNPPSHTGRWRTVPVTATIAFALLVGACGGSDEAPSASPDSAETGTPAPGIDWTSCGERLECARVPVPLDWDDPDGERIKLSVIRHRASRPDERIGTIFTDPGGPGDTGVGLVRDGGDELDTWGDGRFDWIGWDPRGTYASTPVNCFRSEAEEAEFWDGVTIPSTPAESEAYQRRTEDLARRCGEVMGPMLSHISTTDTVRDMDALRELIGEDTITYVGLSYGTMIGQIYANMFPERVRAMMLDGIVDPVAYTTDAETRSANNSESTDEVFDQFLTTCEAAGPDRCALAGHGETPAQRVARLFERARQGPIPAPGATPPGELVYSDLMLSSFAALRDPTTWPEYAEQLNAAVDGDPSMLATAAQEARAPKAFAEATKSAAISCLDGPATKPSTEWPAVIGDLTELSTMAGPIQGWWLWAPCASSWPARSDDRFTGPWDAKTSVPILLIGTRYDPNTGYQNAVRSEQLLGNAVLLTHEGYGHLSFKDVSQCVEDARVRYLVDLVTPPPGTVCQADHKPFM